MCYLFFTIILNFNITLLKAMWKYNYQLIIYYELYYFLVELYFIFDFILESIFYLYVFPSL